MKIVTKNFEVYQFNELSTEAQANALSLLRDINVDESWWLPLYESEEEKIETAGFSDIEISFSGFYSQGDGASFTADKFDFLAFNKVYNLITDKRILKLIEADLIDISGYIKRTSNHYVHERSTTFNLEYNFIGERYEYPRIDEVLSDLEDKISNIVVDMNKEIYRALEAEYDGLTSDESVKGAIDDNEYEFNPDGTMF